MNSLLKKFKSRLKIKNNVTYMAYAVIGKHLFSSIMMFGSAMVIVRALLKEDYGS